MTDELNTISEAILVDAIARMNRLAAGEGEQLDLARYLALQGLWAGLTKVLGYSPDDLREKADEMEDWEAEEEMEDREAEEEMEEPT